MKSNQKLFRELIYLCEIVIDWLCSTVISIENTITYMKYSEIFVGLLLDLFALAGEMVPSKTFTDEDVVFSEIHGVLRSDDVD